MTCGDHSQWEYTVISMPGCFAGHFKIPEISSSSNALDNVIITFINIESQFDSQEI